MKKYYTVSKVVDYHEEIIFQGSKRKLEKWLYDYFTIGEEKWWAWNRFNQLIESPNITFEKYVLLLSKQRKEFGTIRTIRIRKGKMLLIREHEKNIKKVGK